MAISTYTASEAQAGVIPLTGVLYPMVVAGSYVGSANTVSDIVLLAKLPDRAIVHKVEGFINSGQTLATIKVGLSGGGSASETAFGTHTLSAGTATSFNTLDDAIHPVQVSFSDDAEPRVGRVYATLSAGSFTASWTLSYQVHFTTPNE